MNPEPLTPIKCYEADGLTLVTTVYVKSVFQRFVLYGRVFEYHTGEGHFPHYRAVTGSLEALA